MNIGEYSKASNNPDSKLGYPEIRDSANKIYDSLYHLYFNKAQKDNLVILHEMVGKASSQAGLYQPDYAKIGSAVDLEYKGIRSSSLLSFALFKDNTKEYSDEQLRLLYDILKLSRLNFSAFNFFDGSTTYSGETLEKSRLRLTRLLYNNLGTRVMQYGYVNIINNQGSSSSNIATILLNHPLIENSIVKGSGADRVGLVNTIQVLKNMGISLEYRLPITELHNSTNKVAELKSIDFDPDEDDGYNKDSRIVGIKFNEPYTTDIALDLYKGNQADVMIKHLNRTLAESSYFNQKEFKGVNQISAADAMRIKKEYMNWKFDTSADYGFAELSKSVEKRLNNLDKMSVKALYNLYTKMLESGSPNIVRHAIAYMNGIDSIVKDSDKPFKIPNKHRAEIYMFMQHPNGETVKAVQNLVRLAIKVLSPESSGVLGVKEKKEHLYNLISYSLYLYNQHDTYYTYHVVQMENGDIQVKVFEFIRAAKDNTLIPLDDLGIETEQSDPWTAIIRKALNKKGQIILSNIYNYGFNVYSKGAEQDTSGIQDYSIALQYIDCDYQLNDYQCGYDYEPTLIVPDNIKLLSPDKVWNFTSDIIPEREYSVYRRIIREKAEALRYGIEKRIKGGKIDG